MKIALVHDWLTGMRGGEKCLEVFCELFPNADLYTLLHNPGSVSQTIEKMSIYTSKLQHLPLSSKQYRYYLPLFPYLMDSWKLSGKSYDLVLSSSHCVAKGIPIRERKRHVCYCFTPMRYLWCQVENYYQNDWRQTALKLVKNHLRKWDLKSNEKVDEFIGISNNVSNRIRNFYSREAATIYPPVDTEFYQPGAREKRDDFYLIVGALEPYKRVDLAMDAFKLLKRPLKIVGKGTMLDSLKQNKPSHIEFLGWKSNEEIRDLYQRARGLIFPGEEDFGIVPLEAQSCGCPVLAYGAGGILETVVEGETGIFFKESTVKNLCQAFAEFEGRSWNQTKLRTQAEKFSRSRFKEEIHQHLLKEKNS